MPSQRELLVGAGLGLLGFGGVLWLQQKKAAAPPPDPGPRTMGAGQRVSVVTWLNAGRPDVVGALRQGQWLAVFGQYLKEVWPDFLARRDVVGAAGTEQDGQWLRENASGFWMRTDIQAAWFGIPPRKASVVGQYLKDNGGSRYL